MRRCARALRTWLCARFKPGACLVALGSLAALSGCATVSYYSESVSGHLGLLHAARPIDEWLADPSTPADLKARLSEVKEIRTYASAVLGLPDNSSYRSYADLHRPFVVWNVFAAPVLSLELKQWCFPIAGCVTYRGYFAKDEAERYGAALAREGLDVEVAGVPAYSTLGFTPDPVLSTFIHYPEGEVARLIFHELAHQKVYLAGDSTFNESFASTVEQVGVERWLAARGDAELRAGYERFEARRLAFLSLLLGARAELVAVYDSADDDAAKLARKKEVFDALRARYSAAKDDHANPLYAYRGYDGYFAQDLNNAHLAAIATYTQRVGAFVKLLDDEGGDLPRFYAAVRDLSHLPADERDARLDELAKSAS